MKRKVLHISMLLLLPAALMAQSPAGTSAPKLTSAYVKMLGYKGQSFKRPMPPHGHSKTE